MRPSLTRRPPRPRRPAPHPVHSRMDLLSPSLREAGRLCFMFPAQERIHRTDDIASQGLTCAMYNAQGSSKVFVSSLAVPER